MGFHNIFDILCSGKEKHLQDNPRTACHLIKYNLSPWSCILFSNSGNINRKKVVEDGVTVYCARSVTHQGSNVTQLIQVLACLRWVAKRSSGTVISINVSCLLGVK